MDHVGVSMIYLANLIAILLSLVAFGFSIYTLWVVRVSPFRLVVYPPSLSCINPKESALILDFAFHNSGRVRAVVLDIDASLLIEGDPKPVRRLQPQAFHRTYFPSGDLKAPQSVISRFAPISIDPGQMISKTVYFSSRPGEPDQMGWASDAEWESIRVSFKVNGNWNKRTFRITRSEFEGYKTALSKNSVIGFPFVPAFYPELQPLHLRGTIFDPVY